MNRVALIGAGNMGEAMLSGWLESMLGPEQVVVSDVDESKRDALYDRYGVRAASGNGEAASGADVVVIAVKPQDVSGVLDELAGVVGGGTSVISIVAGLPVSKIRGKLGPEPTVVRVMPNVGALVKAAISAYSIDAGSGAVPGEVLGLLEVIGETVEVDEEWMNLVTALSGSGPAYFFYLVEALEEAGVSLGMERDIARKLARETLWGAARILKETGREAEQLRQAVSSPGGTTVAALGELDRAGFKEIITGAVDAARRRAEELAR